MFTRRVIMGIKADSAAEFTRIVEGHVLPGLRGQKGCRHAEGFTNTILSESVVNSYWDMEEYAEAYAAGADTDGLRDLADVVDGVPRVETFHISSSTFCMVTAKSRHAYRAAQLGRG
jgi:hypothetical protein